MELRFDARPWGVTPSVRQFDGECGTLGCSVEGWDAQYIQAVYGAYNDLPAAHAAGVVRRDRLRPTRTRPLGLYSDDTQQALGIAVGDRHREAVLRNTLFLRKNRVTPDS